MPVVFQWDDSAHTICSLTISETWHWQDYERAFKQFVAEVEPVPHAVYLVIDMQGGAPTGSPPCDVVPCLPENLAFAYVTGANGLLRSLTTRYFHHNGFSGRQMRHAVTRDAAYRAITRQKRGVRL